MRVVQVYRKSYWSKELNLLTEPLRAYLTLASVTSWMWYAPQFDRYLYVDQETYDFLKSKQWLGLWDKIEIVDFERLLGPITFYAAPKFFIYTRQTEPFWICDLDLYLTNYIRPDEFDYTKYYGGLYSQSFDIKGFIGYYRALEKFEGMGNVSNLEDCVNGGLIFFPEPVIAQIVGLAMLEMSRETTNQTPGNVICNHHEEAPLATMLRALGRKIERFDSEGHYSHWMGWDKEKVIANITPKVLEEKKNIIKAELGFDPETIAKEFGKLKEKKKTLL